MLLIIVDACALLLAGLLAAWIRFGGLTAPVTIDVGLPLVYWQVAIALAVLWQVVLWAEGLYDMERLGWDFAQAPRIIRGFALGVVAVILLTFALKLPGLSRGWLMLTWFTATILVAAGRWILHRWLMNQHRKGAVFYRTLIVGTNAEARRLVDIMRDNVVHGLVPVGYLCDNTSGAGDGSLDPPLLGRAGDILTVVENEHIDAVIIASSAFEHDTIARMIADLRCAPVRTHISSGLFEVLTSRVIVHEIAGVPLITVTNIGFTPARRALKRTFDVCVAGALVLLGLPLWLLIAGMIKLTSRGPVLYFQRRIGVHGRPFAMCKFRSMLDGADAMLV